jgi:acyl-CoA reductase-like NAD-dependent aldehyde dehydrogenase
MQAGLDKELIHRFPNVSAACGVISSGYSCLVDLGDPLSTALTTRGATLGQLAVMTLPSQEAEVRAAAKQRAKRRAAARAAAAAHRRAVARAKRQVAARKALAARRHAILTGQETGLTEWQVRAILGKPDHTQHIAVTGLTEDYWYYGGFAAGDYSGPTYQLVFQSGVLTGANRY